MIEQVIKGACHWKNRRIMAYGAWFVGLFGYPAMILITGSNNLLQIATPLYTLITFVLTAFYGVATWDHVDQRKHGSKPELTE